MKKARNTSGSKLRPIMQIAIVCLAAYLCLFAILYVGITPEQYDIQIGSPAPTQIKATKDIQDTVTTEALREQAAEEVEPSYKSVDPTVIDEVVADLNTLIDALMELREEYTSETASALTDSEISDICDALGISITRDQLVSLIEASDTTVNELFSETIQEVEDVLDSTLPEGQESNAIKSIRSNLAQLYSTSLTAIAVEVVSACIQPNMLIDEEITEANRQAARDAVQTIWYVKDQVIVAEGEIVTEAQYTMIAALGILDENSIDAMMMVGIALLIALLMIAAGFYLRQFYPSMLRSPKDITLLCLIIVLVVALCLVFRYIHSYLMPVSLGLLLVTMLIDGRLAIVINMILSLLILPLAPAGTGVFTYAVMSCICAPLTVSLLAKTTLRTSTLLAGVIIGVCNFLLTMAVGLINSAEMYDVVVNAGVAAGSGVVSAILCIGISPVLEWMFNLATPSKLIELSNPNQPLMRRLLLEASGTYHHSIIVANLAEAACSAIGANGLLARVGSYYHDIGKLKRPLYFKENQMGDNPHDRTDPRVSTAILTAHTRDGVQMAQKARIPTPVIDIIQQHHGDTPVMYFYDKAKKLYGDEVDISAFRYEGPRPQSREAAVVMLADTVEAATRSLSNPDPEKIDALIHKLVRAKLNDGQLDSSYLTFNDLEKICGAFSTVLTGVFHERIEYPDVVIPPRTPTLNKAETEERAEIAGDTAPSIPPQSDEEKQTACEESAGAEPTAPSEGPEADEPPCAPAEKNPEAEPANSAGSASGEANEDAH